MFILSSTSGSLEFWSVNHTSIYEISELNVFKNIIFFSEVSNNWSNDLLGTKVLLNHVDNRCCQYYNGLILLQ